ncbi:MAG TPA: zinc-binding dehydrogenase, partial [Casimicrobiaceae bacterium]
MASQHTICGSTLDVVRTLAAAGVQPPALWLVTAGAPESASLPGSPALLQSTLWGLGRVVMREHPELRCRLVDMAPVVHDEDIDALALEVSSGDDNEEELAFRRGARFVRRLHRAADHAVVSEKRPPQPDEQWGAHIGTPGALQTLEFRPRPLATLDADRVDVRIAAASINFRDVMLAMGTIPGLEQEPTLGSRQLGLDAAGTVVACGSRAERFKPGDAVMGIVAGAFGSRGTTAEALLVRKPARLDFEQAACVPCVFVTAHYALNHLARLREGERVLIHSAAGGVGLAAIQFAKAAGAEIFATAGSDEKRAYLASLGIRHVMDSRSTAFADEILRITGGEGVDVVLNSLAGDALAAGLRVLRPFGRFLEIGKRDIYADAQLGLLPFRKNLSLHAIDLDRLCVERPSFVGTLLSEVADRFDSGQLQPLPQRSWPISQLEEAMRLMAQARHTGKMALSIDDPGVALSGPRARAALCRVDGT